MASLFGGMADELKNRPALHPSADDALAAFAKAGVGVDAPTQSIGRTYKARYCVHGVTKVKDISALVCEYANEADAAVGLAESKKLFPTLKSREGYTHKSLLLVTNFQETDHLPAATAAQHKVLAAFNAL